MYHGLDMTLRLMKEDSDLQNQKIVKATLNQQ